MFGKNCDKYRQIKENNKRIQEIGQNLEVVNLGSTVAMYDFDYEIIGKKGANLALAPQPLFYDYRLLKQYVGNLAEHADVCICLCHFTFLVENYSNPAAQLKYYDCLEKHLISGYSPIRHFFWEKAPVFVMPSLAKSHLNSKNTRIAFNIDAPAEKWMQGWKTEFGWTEDYEIAESQLAIAEKVYRTLCEITDFCWEQRKKPLVILMPFSQELHQEIPKELLEECFWPYIRRYRESGGEVLDLLSDQELMNKEYYCKSLILNEVGKKIFNQKISEYLDRRKKR